MGLRRKISLMALLITVISIFITASIGLYVNYQLEKENIYGSMTSEVSKINGDVNNWLDGKTQVISVLGRAIENENMDKDQIRKLLIDFNQDPEISDIYLGFSDGDFISAVKWLPPEGYDPRVRPWYVSLENKDEVTFSPPYLDYTTGEYAVSVGKPIKNKKGEVIGVLAEDILVDTLFKRLSNIQFQEIGYAFMIDSQGNLLAHPDEALKKISLRNHPELGILLRTMETKRNGITDYKYLGEDKVAAFQEVVRSGWIIGVVVPKSAIYEPLQKVLLQFLLLFLIISALSILISYKLSRNLVGRINRLLVKTEQIAQGQFDEVVESSGEDEITSLSHSFNQMGEKIRAYIAELDEYNQSLEQKVALGAQEIAERKLQLVEAEKLNSLSYLVSGVAHEMNTPIGNCIMLASYMDTMVSDLSVKIDNGTLTKGDFLKNNEELGLCCQKLLSNLDIGKKLIADFKELSVEEIGYKPIPLDIEEVIWRSYHNAKEEEGNLNLDLEITVEPNLVLVSDTLRIYKLFCELIANSFHHGYEGRKTGKICIEVQSEPLSGGYLIRYSDDGSGLEPHVMEKAFTPFFSTKFSGDHNGLGLSVVYNIVKSLSGDIHLSNMVTGGTLIEMVIERPTTDQSQSTNKDQVL